MILLNYSDYNKVIPSIQNVKINTYFAASVLAGNIKGKVFVDNIKTPSSFYIKHPYGMSLLFGNSKNEEFNKELYKNFLNLDNSRNKFEWLQVYPSIWYSKIDNLLGAALIKKEINKAYLTSFSTEEVKNVLEYQRINYSFNKTKYKFIRNKTSSSCYKIIRTTEEIYNQLKGSVIPSQFWNDSKDFYNNSIGFSLQLENSLPVSTAFASFIIDNKFELGIETIEGYRGKSYAFHVSLALIDYCVSNGFEPIWSCHSGNFGSQKLANKIGFEESLRIPYYRLSK